MLRAPHEGHGIKFRQDPAHRGTCRDTPQPAAQMAEADTVWMLRTRGRARIVVGQRAIIHPSQIAKCGTPYVARSKGVVWTYLPTTAAFEQHGNPPMQPRMIPIACSMRLCGGARGGRSSWRFCLGASFSIAAASCRAHERSASTLPDFASGCQAFVGKPGASSACVRHQADARP